MNTRFNNKNSNLNLILSKNFGNKLNLARIKFFGLFICALCKVQTVCFEKLSASFDTEAKVDSSLRRIQRFIAEYVLDTDIISKLIFSLLPHEPPYRLAIDRTNWKFGTVDINILVLAIVSEGVAFPIMFKIAIKLDFHAKIFLMSLCAIFSHPIEEKVR